MNGVTETVGDRSLGYFFPATQLPAGWSFLWASPPSSGRRKGIVGFPLPVDFQRPPASSPLHVTPCRSPPVFDAITASIASTEELPDQSPPLAASSFYTATGLADFLLMKSITRCRAVSWMLDGMWPWERPSWWRYYLQPSRRIGGSQPWARHYSSEHFTWGNLPYGLAYLTFRNLPASPICIVRCCGKLIHQLTLCLRMPGKLTDALLYGGSYFTLTYALLYGGSYFKFANISSGIYLTELMNSLVNYERSSKMSVQ